MLERQYMERAIRLAKKGKGWTNPNPLVGAVIVKNGKIIGEGYHEKYGGLHAERNAIASLKESAKGAEIYVTLEPCCHYGKTPPCTEAIIEQGIKKVIIGSRDPNPLVSGKGAAILRKAGIEVVEDFMREECDLLNPIFFHYIEKKLPYVTIKYAMTADGKIATKTGRSKWITGEEARKRVHRFRHEHMAIMAGIGTVQEDDPMLNVRIDGLKSPVRIICDSHLSISEDSKIVQTAKKYHTIIACVDGDEEKKERLEKQGIEILTVPEKDHRIDLKKLMERLGEKGIDSIFIEGGGAINDSALKEGIVSRIYVFMAPKIFGGAGAKTPVEGCGIEDPKEAVMLKLEEAELVGTDLLLEYKVKGEV